jgi:hypothetical protein
VVQPRLVVLGSIVVRQLRVVCQVCRYYLIELLPGAHNIFDPEYNRDSTRINTVLAFLSARQLLDATRALLARDGKLEPDAVDALNPFERFIERRNKVVHSNWCIGDPELNEVYDVATAYRLVKGHKHPVHGSDEYSLSGLRTHIAEANGLHRSLVNLWRGVMGMGPLSADELDPVDEALERIAKARAPRT